MPTPPAVQPLVRRSCATYRHRAMEAKIILWSTTSKKTVESWETSAAFNACWLALQLTLKYNTEKGPNYSIVRLCSLFIVHNKNIENLHHLLNRSQIIFSGIPSCHFPAAVPVLDLIFRRENFTKARYLPCPNYGQHKNIFLLEAPWGQNAYLRDYIAPCGFRLPGLKE